MATPNTVVTFNVTKPTPVDRLQLLPTFSSTREVARLPDYESEGRLASFVTKELRGMVDYTNLTINNYTYNHYSGATARNLAKFRTTARTYQREGIVNEETSVEVPTVHPKIKYLNSFDNIYNATDGITCNDLLFVYEGGECEFEGSERDFEDEEYHDTGTECIDIPRFYFRVRVITSGQNAGSKHVQFYGGSPWKCDGKVFPHSDSSGSEWGGFCFGGNFDDMEAALVLDDLSMWLDMFALYLSRGVDSTDSYGEGWYKFQDCGYRSTEVHMRESNDSEQWLNNKIKEDIGENLDYTWVIDESKINISRRRRIT